MRPVIRIAIGGLLALLPLPALADGESFTCQLDIICLDASPCSDWDNAITVTETDEGYRIDWQGDLTSEYAVVAQMPPPEGAIEPTDITSLFYAYPETQALQLVSFDGAGNITVTLHQPHLRPRAVTGFGTCDMGGDG